MAKNPAAKRGPRDPSKRKTKPDAPGASGAQGAAPAGHNSDRTEDQIRELFLTNRTAWNEWKAKRAVVDKLERDVKSTLKADGYTVKQFEIADQLLTIKGEAKVSGEVKDRLKVARWIGHPMGAQYDLFAQPDRTPSVDRAFDNGKQASMENQPCKPPHDPSTPQYASWMAGYQQHQATLAGGFRKPDAAEPAAAAQPAGEPESGTRVSRSEFKKRLGENDDAANQVIRKGQDDLPAGEAQTQPAAEGEQPAQGDDGPNTQH